MRINETNAGEFIVSGFVKSSMFLGEKERYFILDDDMKEWIVDAYDIGLTRYQGNVTISAADDKIHLIKTS
ncbi:hypothetical protein D3C85_1697280 [compost metagenome]